MTEGADLDTKQTRSVSCKSVRGMSSVLDAPGIINFAFHGNGNVAAPGSLAESLVYLDVSGDGNVTQLDALQVINELNRFADLDFVNPPAPASEPLPNSKPKSIDLLAAEETWSREDQRLRETTIDAILSESNLF